MSSREAIVIVRKPAAKTMWNGQVFNETPVPRFAGLERQELKMRGRISSFLRGLGEGRRGDRGLQDVKIETGMAFARMIAGNVTETARVSEIISDGSGIPHIRFSVQVHDQNGLHNEGTRVLSRASFLSTYYKLK